MDLYTELAPLFLDEPALPSTDVRLRAGRRVLLRRRLGVGVASLATIAALGASYVVTSAVMSTDSPHAVEAAGRTQPSRGAAVPTADDRSRGFTLDHLTGKVRAVDGAVVRDAVEVDPDPGWDGAVAVDVLHDDVETWYVVSWDRGGAGWSSESSVTSPPRSDVGFRAWARDPVVGGTSTERFIAEEVYSVDGFGVVTIRPGVQLVRRIENPLGLAAPYTSTGLEVRWRDSTYDLLLTPSGGTITRMLPGLPTLEQQIADYGRTTSFASWGADVELTAPGADGLPVVLPGVEVLRTVDNPLGVTPPRRSVAYELRDTDGATWWVLWELGPSGLRADQTVLSAGDGYPDLESWLADQVSRATW